MLIVFSRLPTQSRAENQHKVRKDRRRLTLHTGTSKSRAPDVLSLKKQNQNHLRSKSWRRYEYFRREPEAVPVPKSLKCHQAVQHRTPIGRSQKQAHQNNQPITTLPASREGIRAWSLPSLQQALRIADDIYFFPSIGPRT